MYQSRGQWKAFGICIILLAVACSTNPPTPTRISSSPRLAEIQRSGKLRVATAMTRPFEYRPPPNNTLIGLDVDLITLIAQQLGVAVDWQEMAFADLLDAVRTGTADAAIGAIYITPTRLEVADFSAPYLQSGLVMVVRAKESRISTTDDLAGMLVGVKIKGTGEQWADKTRTEKNIAMQIRRYESTADSLKDLENGFLDVVLNDKFNTLEYMKMHPNIRIQGEVFEPAQLGIAFRKGDSDLVEFTNGVLIQLKTSGGIQRLFEKWFQ